MNLGNQFHGSSVPLVNQVNESKGPLPGPLFMCLGISGFWIISSDITQSTSTQACLLLLSLLQKTTIHRLWGHCSLPRAVKFCPGSYSNANPSCPMKPTNSKKAPHLARIWWRYIPEPMLSKRWRQLLHTVIGDTWAGTFSDTPVMIVWCKHEVRKGCLQALWGNQKASMDWRKIMKEEQGIMIDKTCGLRERGL